MCLKINGIIYYKVSISLPDNLLQRFPKNCIDSSIS